MRIRPDENGNSRGPWIPFAVCLAAGLGIALLIALGRGLSRPLWTAQNMRCLSDGLFVSAVMLTGLGLLILISAKSDFFDIFTYGFHSLLMLFTLLRKPRDVKRYYEYKQERKERRGDSKGWMLAAGGVCLVLSFVCLRLFYRL